MTIDFLPYSVSASDGKIINYIHITSFNDELFEHSYYVDLYYVNYDYSRNKLFQYKSNTKFRETLREYKIPILEK